MFQVRIHGRGGQGVVTAAELLSVAAFLGGKPWLMGEEPCGADASAWSMVAGTLCPHFETPIRTPAERHANLVAYRDRGMQRWFPEYATAART